MRKPILTLSLIAALSSLMTAANADIVVWSQNFDSETLGPYGTVENYGTVPPPDLNIVAPGMGGAGQAMEITYTPSNSVNVNFQCITLRYPAAGNTNILLRNYTLEFDMQISPFSPGFAMEISVQGTNGGTFATNVSRFNIGSPPLPTGGSGYMHISLPLSNSVAGNAGVPVDPSGANFRIGFGVLAFPSGIGDGATVETIDVDNIVLLMNTNPPPIPPPTLNIAQAKPGLRIFEQNASQVFNQEGIGTVDGNQSWLGSTPANPTTYKINIASFPSDGNSSLHMQFVTVPAPAVNPFLVFSQPNALDWRIRRNLSTVNGGYFQQRVSWKTNSPNNGGLPNVAVNNVTNTSLTGIGTWTLTFTNDTDGTLIAPDGSTVSFSLPPDAAALFVNPVELCIGTTPGSTAGFGQFFDINRITLTNSVTGNLNDDDFTKDDVLNTSLWDPAFSLDAGSVIQVSSNSPAFWVNWTTPDDLFGLGTKAGLTGGTNAWFTPNYYGSNIGATNTQPRKMGALLKWTLVPSPCLPTVDGTVGGPASQSGFFRLQNPPPTQ